MVIEQLPHGVGDLGSEEPGRIVFLTLGLPEGSRLNHVSNITQQENLFSYCVMQEER